ncbi:MAG TPA: ATP-binding protein [Planktothrix sp.]
MLFDHRPIEQLTDEELRSLIGRRENEHIEFKVIYNLSGADSPALNEEKYELLKDVASMANAGGGYIFVGVRANEKSIAVKFESIENKIVERLKQSISALCVDHIEERISGLEVKDRSIEGATIIVIRIPNSVRIPHMVKFLNNTHFARRYQEGKREMSFAEIRFSFSSDQTERRLASIEQLLLRGVSKAPTGTDCFSDNSLNELADGKALANSAVEDFVKRHDEPALYIGVVPRHPIPTLIDLSNKLVSDFLQAYTNEDRELGWNMQIVSRKRINKSSARISMGEPDVATISILANGYMSFQTPLNGRFCWGQSDEEFKSRPRFSPYAVVEFAVSFLRMYRRFIDTFSISDHEWCVVICYHKVNGYFLAPGHPMSPFYDSGDAKMYTGSDDILIADLVSGEFIPDVIGYKLLSRVYECFGLTEKNIPFFVDEQSVFDIR